MTHNAFCDKVKCKHPAVRAEDNSALGVVRRGGVKIDKLKYSYISMETCLRSAGKLCLTTGWNLEALPLPEPPNIRYAESGRTSQNIIINLYGVHVVDACVQLHLPLLVCTEVMYVCTILISLAS